MKNVYHESLNDTFIDIAGYAMIAHLLYTGQWKDGLQEDKTVAVTFLGTVMDTFTTKLADYGLRDMTEVGLEGVASRLTDKLARLKNIIKTEGDPLRVKKTNAHGTIHPPQKSGDVGYDLEVAEGALIPPRSSKPIMIAAGVSVKIPNGYFGWITSRSSATGKGLVVFPGIIDNGYTGDLFAIVWNTSQDDIMLRQGERIAQMILLPAFTPPMKYVEELPSTDRGSSGFGSTNTLGE